MTNGATKLASNDNFNLRRFLRAEHRSKEKPTTQSAMQSGVEGFSAQANALNAEKNASRKLITMTTQGILMFAGYADHAIAFTMSA